ATATSSHAHHELGVKDNLITEHLQYRQLGTTTGERDRTYREIMREPLPPRMIGAIRTALEEERVLGDEGFH
ncbi:MAG: transposase, partial [Betaproteobacteria bacterium]|nr:transposase [Betaproteobacteria bacterium]